MIVIRAEKSDQEDSVRVLDKRPTASGHAELRPFPHRLQQPQQQLQQLLLHSESKKTASHDVIRAAAAATTTIHSQIQENKGNHAQDQR